MSGGDEVCREILTLEAQSLQSKLTSFAAQTSTSKTAVRALTHPFHNFKEGWGEILDLVAVVISDFLGTLTVFQLNIYCKATPGKSYNMKMWESII